MPLEVYSSEDALRTARANKDFRGWPTRKVNDRVEPVALPDFKPTFALEPGETIFTIGSCFARNIEQDLANLGFDVVVRRLSANARFIETHGTLHQLNKYHPHSILNEFQWALEPERWAHPDPAGYLEIGADAWLDANMHAAAAAPLETVRQKRQLALENARAVKECRVVVMTPGLVEAWWDRETASYVNETPPASFMRRHPDRFELHILSYDEVIDAFTCIHALLSRHLSSDFKILLTISPVPMNTTFRGDDVMVANAYSKSVLRAAAEEFRTRHSNVDYFPSYESITLSKREFAWLDDHIHPTDEIVRVNVCRMVERYLEVPDPAIASKLRESLDQLHEVEMGWITRLKSDLAKQSRMVEQLQAAFALQQEAFQAKDAQLKHAQDTATRYLRQVMERDGLLPPSQEAESGGV